MIYIVWEYGVFQLVSKQVGSSSQVVESRCVVWQLKYCHFVVLIVVCCVENWLEYNHVHIICFSKTVHISSGEEESGAEFLTTKQLKQLARDGIPMFSLMASLSVENQAVIDKLQVVCEFPKVFPDEIPDVPLVREVEFLIDLVPGTKPVSMAP